MKIYLYIFFCKINERLYLNIIEIFTKLIITYQKGKNVTK